MQQTHIHLHLLISDWLVWMLVLLSIAVIFYMRQQPHLREPWQQVFRSKMGMIAFVILSFYVAIGLLDSIHLQISDFSGKQQNQIQIKTAFDLLISPLGQQDEKTYSAPFATHLYTQALTTLPNGKEVRSYPKLKYVTSDTSIIVIFLKAIAIAFMVNFILLGCLFGLIVIIKKQSFISLLKKIYSQETRYVWRAGIITFIIMITLITTLYQLATHYHILGTDKVGSDVFYESLKSIRTGLLIGTLTTLFMLPFALLLGTIAGFFGGVVDDIIQYLYTTLSSIPGVLLISASVLVLQVYIANHQSLFPTLIQRADARLLALCFILGITSWASLCRFLRAETLKLREQEFIQAAYSLGVKKRKIITRHIIPNVMHIVLITLVLDFSSLVLAEAVLSYVGVGVDPTTFSWGNMINSSRLELAREPIVWWPLLSAMIFMFGLVLSANLFADRVRDAFDPRLRNVRT